MKISVIIPTYNPGGYLFECLESVFKQTLNASEYEVLIILNGDQNPYENNIKKFLLGYERVNNIKYFYSSKKGVSIARNIGLDLAIGEYICFVDDDDIVSENFLSELYNVSSPDYVGLCNIFSFHNHPSEMGTEFFVSDYIRYKKRIENADVVGYRRYISYPVAKLYHRDIIKSRRFDTRFTNGEDGLFSRLISDKYKGLRCTSESAVYYVRIRIGSASRSKLSLGKILKDTILLWFVLIKYYFSNPRDYSFKLYAYSILSVLKNSFILLKNR
jgi:putative glycosyltransferase protein